MRSLLAALYAERRALYGCLVILFRATLVAATTMHLVERQAQPDKFGTISSAMWWAIGTLSTIGYGDVVPITNLGKLVAAATVVTGLIMVALPIGIVATAFANEVHRRDFVVTWSMVARVPVFAGLNAIEIADIMELLRAQQVEAGEVSSAAANRHIRCTSSPPERWRSSSDTSTFGLVPAIFSARSRRSSAPARSATVAALTRTSLLVLDAHERSCRIALSHSVGLIGRARDQDRLIKPAEE
jgi:voltage-gated potassium channel